uniref:TPM domain-containing protein n=1 Tax=Wuchereria bancrofti TaxID=6293 RepID=A0A1I8EMG4_WUCBA
MLSFLSMILSSSTVLRTDTERWTSKTYPDPRLNFSQCHTWPGSALCDPDYILTDQWRLDINNNINLQNSRLCRQNDTKPPHIYVILAKRIQTQMNQTIATSEDALVNLGNEIVKELDLKSEFRSNFIIVLGVADAKKVFIQTGQDLELPDDFLSSTFRKYDNLFNVRNHMEGLNDVITEMARKIIDHLNVSVVLNI